MFPTKGTHTSIEIGFVLGFVVALAVTFIIVPWLIPRLKARGIVGKDLNKPGSPEVAEMGGIPVVVGFFAGISVLLSFNHITNKDLLNVSLSAILGAAFVGMMDDLFDMRQRHKALLPFILALPLGVSVNHEIVIPHVGVINFGFLMPLAAAFAVTCAANASNMLEGFNGLGTGMGIIMSWTLVVLAVIHNRLDGVYLLIPLMGALIAFLWFNKYPARIFPGDTMMLFMGATIAVAGILSQLHVQTIIIFLPMIVEFFLKFRGHFKAENYCSNSTNGYIEYHGRVESLTHIFMKHMKIKERELVLLIWGVEVAICAFVISVDLLI